MTDASQPDSSISDSFEQYHLPPTPTPSGNISPTPGGSMVQQGVLKSPNFVHNLRGWQVDSEGNAEFNNLQIKNNFITVPLGGDIQSAINTMAEQGGGEVRLGAGTYTLTASLSVPS